MADEFAGGCHCGAIRYTVAGTPVHAAICHCTDCRRSAGAPMVAWSAFQAGQVAVTQGAPQTFASSENVTRSFCGTCGTGLFFVNEVVLPGLIDVQTATLDQPEILPPQAQIQLADRIGWTSGLESLPGFARFPGQES